MIIMKTINCNGEGNDFFPMFLQLTQIFLSITMQTKQRYDFNAFDTLMLWREVQTLVLCHSVLRGGEKGDKMACLLTDCLHGF